MGEELEPLRPALSKRSTTLSPEPESPVLTDDQVDPGLNVLFPSHSLRQQDLRIASRTTARASRGATHRAMTEQTKDKRPSSEAIPARPAPKTELSTGSDGTTATIDSAVDLKSERSPKTAEAGGQLEATAVSLAARPRQATPGAADVSDASRDAASRPTLGSPLRIETSAPSRTHAPDQDGDSIARSPILSKHTISEAEDRGDNLRPYEHTSPATSSPHNERLPSFRQLAGSLTDLAEAATAATQEITRQQQQPYSHHRSRSFGSATSHSPVMSNHPYPANMQTSPQAYYPPSLSARSPTSTVAETAPYGSPSAYPSYGFFAQRRPSNVADGPPPMPSLPSASSSGESHGYGPSPGMESYSTQHTTPIDPAQLPEGTPRVPPAQMLPVPIGMQPPPIMIPAPYKCDVQGCMAGTFQTQYLLK